jgi:hypothetical protein
LAVDRAFGATVAIFAPVSREDPKHGRWILPLVVAGLIGFTYVFVTALPEAEEVAPTTTTTSSTTTTLVPTTVTTTTLDPEAAAFIEASQTIGRNVADLADLAQQINDSWDARDVTYTPTREALEDLETQTATLDELVNATVVPDSGATEWEAVTAGLEEMKEQAAAMIFGLVEAEGTQPRIDALEAYKTAGDAVENSLGDVRRAVRNAGG